MKKSIFALCLLFVFGLAFAQTNIVKIKATNSDVKDGLRIYEVERKTETLGNYASTTIEYMIENRTSRILEGEFEFPLADGENVSGYALDINGRMRDASVVEKEKGRKVFEEIVRRGVDPGLVEMTEGNNFKTRVYPIPANGVRHLKVTVEKEIPFGAEKIADEVFTQTIGKDTYFYAPIHLGEFDVPTEKSLPKSVTVLFDVSSSAKNRDTAKEIDFLLAYLKNAGTGEVTVIPFSNATHDMRTFVSSNFSELETYLKKQNFDGATNLRLNLSKISSDEILLFSDGIENWSDGVIGSEKDFDYKSGLPIHTINSSKSANFANLKKIATSHNGLFINLGDLDANAAASKLSENPLRIMKIDFDQNEIAEVYPEVGSIVEKGFSLTGILKKKTGTVKISLGRNGAIEKTIEKTVSAVDSKESEKVSRLWAMKKLSSLEIDYDANRSEIIALSKKFSIVTKEMSLIVLENVSDYVRYGITPPEELREEYERLVSRQSQSKVSETPLISKIVYTKFEEFRKWWKKTPKDFEEEAKNNAKNNAKSAGTVRRLAPMYSTMAVENAVPMAEESVVMDSVVEAPRMMQMTAKAESLAAAPAAASPSGTDSVSVKLQAWSSNSDYISVLKKTATDKMYEKYIELKKSYENSPAFYMEASDYFAEEGLSLESVRILSNLAEMNLENTDILRALGNKLVEKKNYWPAVFVFEKLTKIRSEVPQFYRDLALAYNLVGEKQKAIDSLWHIASKSWDGRYSEIQQTALNDMNAIIADSQLNRLDLSKIDSELMQNFDMDVRIVLTWNTDDCDVDLWVTDPNGEKCYYGHKQTVVGGRMSRDFTQGYGPEEFCLKVAPKGKYKIEANYFGNRQQKILQPVIVQAEVYTNFGRENQKREVLTLQLDDIKQTFLIGEVEF